MILGSKLIVMSPPGLTRGTITIYYMIGNLLFLINLRITFLTFANENVLGAIFILGTK